MTTSESSPRDIEISVVIAARDRPDLLARCLGALAAQVTSRRFEVVVVDDGSTPPLAQSPAIERASRAETAAWDGVRVLRGHGEGPGGARTRGIAAASGTLVFFTDDDTFPSPGWIEAGAAWLAARPDDVGVEGPTRSPPFDPYREHGISTPAGGWLTCNIAYRRDALIAIGGFWPGFRYPSSEDLDLAIRAQTIGAIGFAPAMEVVHPIRPVSLRSLVRRGRHMPSEVMLKRRHPQWYVDDWPGPRELIAFIGPPVVARRHARTRRSELLRDPQEMARILAVVLGQMAVGVWSMIVGFRAIRGTRAWAPAHVPECSAPSVPTASGGPRKSC